MQQVHPNILLRCRKGDKKAFRAVVEQYEGMVFSLALKLLCDEDEAMDAAQETFIRVWLNMMTIRKSARYSPRGYIPSRRTSAWTG